jgi:CBS domain-containing protein
LIRDVLTAKHTDRWVDPVIQESASVREAIIYTVEGGLSGMMVLRDEKVVGLVSSRDLLRILAAGLNDPRMDAESLMKATVETHMTPIRQVIYARPDETVGMCRAIMAKLGLKCLPILEDNQVKGLITARDMSDYGLRAIDKGGKEQYLQTVSTRVGLSSNTTSMAEPPHYLRAHLALEQQPLYMNIGTAALPHPYKLPGGQVARDQRGTDNKNTHMDQPTVVVWNTVSLTPTAQIPPLFRIDENESLD